MTGLAAKDASSWFHFMLFPLHFDLPPLFWKTPSDTSVSQDTIWEKLFKEDWRKIFKESFLFSFSFSISQIFLLYFLLTISLSQNKHTHTVMLHCINELYTGFPLLSTYSPLSSQSDLSCPNITVARVPQPRKAWCPLFLFAWCLSCPDGFGPWN